ncbi:hypothetical protein ACFQZZ_21640 [Nocardia sp. GCM10030253]|uniref:hypothetical protein n=1 Tax=Nocardia sp. GCM10030253 TaxID=3273404 RepID=UPI0036269E66
MAWSEGPVRVTPAEENFFRARSKAFADQFMAFVVSRGLDMDTDTWPDADRRDFEVGSRELIAQWKYRAQQLIDDSLSDRVDFGCAQSAVRDMGP